MVRITTQVRCVLLKAAHRIALTAWVFAIKEALDTSSRANEIIHRNDAVNTGAKATCGTSHSTTSCTVDTKSISGEPGHGVGATSSERVLAHLHNLTDSVLDMSLAEILREKQMCIYSVMYAFQLDFLCTITKGEVHLYHT